MKKSVVVVLVLLAIIVLLSPAIVGRLAEKSMDESLNWAASESREVKITSGHYDRGWFSSEGQHRIELLDGELLAAVRALTGPMEADEVPVLVINTRLDHGLIPMTSMSREHGSLAPGLGSAISTLLIELPDGETVDLPGTIYSTVALGGELHSNYVLEAGVREDGGMMASWGDTNVDVRTNPKNGEVWFDGEIGALSFDGGQESMSLAGLTFEGHQQPTQYGFSVGDIEFVLNDLSASAGGISSGGLREMAVRGSTQVNDGAFDAKATVRMALQGMPQFGEMSYDMDIQIRGADAQALGQILGGLRTGPSPQDPLAMYAAVEDEAKQLFAAGLEIDFERFDLALPPGTVAAKMAFSFGEEDPATFEWTTLLLSTAAEIDLSIPEALMEMLVQSDPQVAMAIGGGFLVKKGGAYVMKAELKKGLLTVNGAPIPIPLP